MKQLLCHSMKAELILPYLNEFVFDDDNLTLSIDGKDEEGKYRIMYESKTTPTRELLDGLRDIAVAVYSVMKDYKITKNPEPCILINPPPTDRRCSCCGKVKPLFKTWRGQECVSASWECKDCFPLRDSTVRRKITARLEKEGGF